jgi:predicted patatin/cPLA2 family phospholipase
VKLNSLEELLKEIKEYRNDMVARNYPYQRISDIITRWEMKKVTEQVAREGMKDFLEEAEKEKKELNESYKESVRQANERKE